MKTQIAKQIAEFHMGNHMVQSPVRRPPIGHRFMVRFPASPKGKLIMGDSPEQIMQDLTAHIRKSGFRKN